MRIKVIANPGAGQPEPVLSVLNDTLGEAGIEWDVARDVLTTRDGAGAMQINAIPK